MELSGQGASRGKGWQPWDQIPPHHLPFISRQSANKNDPCGKALKHVFGGRDSSLVSGRLPLNVEHTLRPQGLQPGSHLCDST